MHILNVAEKPSMAKQIAFLLSSGTSTKSRGRNKYCSNYEFEYRLEGQLAKMIMTSVLGHILKTEFPAQYSNWSARSPSELFDAPISRLVSDDMASIKNNLQSLARNAARLIIWTDCDREGENIGAEIADICRQANGSLEIYRARYSVVNATEINRACQQLSRLDMNQVAAVDVRTELDLRTGAAFTRLQTLAFRNHFPPDLLPQVISYGSCQFPTLGFVVEQYWRVLRFVSEEFWSIDVECQRQNTTVKFLWDRGRLFDRLSCLILYERCLAAQTFHVTSIESKPTSKWQVYLFDGRLISLCRRPLPLRTVELQKSGARFLKMNSHQIMLLAEDLYNKGYISYPRTETDLFENNFDVRSLVSKQEADPLWGGYAKKLTGGAFRWPRRGKNSDKAHPPIHPTKFGGDLTGDAKRVFEFIARRFLACCSEDAKGHETIVKGLIGDEAFTVKGVVILELNYLEIYIYEKWTVQELPPFRRGEEFIPDRIMMRTGQTTPPRLLSEPDLIATMDKNGIGTDATIHEHIKKILDREYVMKTPDARFQPSELGIALVEGYDRIGLEHSLTRPQLRAQMEADLKKICEQRKQKETTLAENIAQFKAMYFRVENQLDILIEALKGQLASEHIPSTRFSPPPPPSPPDFPNGTNTFGTDNDQPPPNCPCGIVASRQRVTKPGPNQGRHFFSCKTCNFFQWAGAGAPADQLDSNAAPLCSCGAQSISRIVSKEGANKGRPFYACARRTGGCEFFKWHDEKFGEQSPTIASCAWTPTLAPRSLDANPYLCLCGTAAVLRTVSKAGENNGRQFYACSKGRDGSCQFFLWKDNLTGNHGHSKGKTEYKCECGLIAVPDKCRKGINIDRVFFKCSKQIRKCAFFFWADEEPGQSSSSAREGHWSNGCPLKGAASKEVAMAKTFGKGRGNGSNTRKRRNQDSDYD